MRAWVAHAPALVVGAVVAVGLGGVALAYWRRGTQTLGAALLLAALLRLLLPEERAGLLVARSRAYDVSLLTVVGAALVVLGGLVPYVPPLPEPGGG